MYNRYCNSIFSYSKNDTITVNVGGVGIGGSNKIVVQSMGTESTNEIDSATAQAIDIWSAGAALVRFTAQGTKEAENLGVIKNELIKQGFNIPLVADIHFNPKAAFVAASHVEKVRINPGNFVERKRNGSSYTPEMYTAELQKIDQTMKELLDICKLHNTAIRVGVNHGSLSGRIVDKYGDTPEGMVESAMEFLRVAVKYEFKNVVVSLKSSNTQVMVKAYRLLAAQMRLESMKFPLHLGVTEAGDGIEGRLRSAVGIGAILADGLGDTIRVSLTEDPKNEVIFANLLLDYVAKLEHAKPINEVQLERLNELEKLYAPYSNMASKIPFIVVKNNDLQGSTDDINKNDIKNSIEIGFDDIFNDTDIFGYDYLIVNGKTAHEFRAILLWIESKRGVGAIGKVVVKKVYNDLSEEAFLAAIGVDFGSLLIDGFADGVWIEYNDINIVDTILALLQASRRRVSKTEYISCPGCGRTLYDIQKVVSKVKEATVGLKNIKIAVMGCIVNGPGEMADADYGYVGSARGEVTLYKAGEPIAKHIKEEEAIDKLVELLKSNDEFR